MIRAMGSTTEDLGGDKISGNGIHWLVEHLAHFSPANLSISFYFGSGVQIQKKTLNSGK